MCLNGNKEKLIPNKENAINESTNYDAMEEAARAAELARIAEEARQKRIKAYQNLINGIKNVASQILSVNAELCSVQKEIEMCMTGNLVNLIKDTIETAQDGIENTINNLNSIGAKAADKIKNEGEACTYEEEHANLESAQYANNNQFSCNTNLLRQSVLPSLQNSYRNLNGSSLDASNLPSLEGCEEVSNISTEIDNVGSFINQAYKKVEEFIENVEKKEKENVGIVERLMNYVSRLFNKKEENIEDNSNEITEVETQNESVSNTTTTPKFGTLWNFTQEYMENIVNEPVKTTFFDNNVNYTLSPVENPNGINYVHLNPNTDTNIAIIWLHGSGEKGGSLEFYSKNNYNLAKILNETKLTKINAHVISPHLAGNYYQSAWCNDISTKYVEDLINQFKSENPQVDTIILSGGSLGGQGTYYIGEKLQESLAGLIVVSGGYGISNFNYEDIQIPIKAYDGKWDAGSKDFTYKYIAPHIGEENIKNDIAADHGEMPSVLFNLDEDGNGKADVFEEIEKMIGVNNNHNLDINEFNSLIQGNKYKEVREYLESLGVDLTEDENVGNSNFENKPIETTNIETIENQDEQKGVTDSSTSDNSTSNNSTNSNPTSNNSTNNSSTSGSLLGSNNSLTDMIMDKHVVEILANKYGVDTAGKTAIAILDEIVIKHPDLAQDLNDIKGMINSNIRFEGAANTSSSTQIEINNNSGIVEELETEDAREEHINQEKDDITNNPISNPEEKEPIKPNSSSTNTENSTNISTDTKPSTPNNPGKLEKPIVKGNPEAILKAAKNAEKTTSHSEYISNILYNAGYLTEKEMKLYKDYSIEEICEKFEGFGWEKITDINKLEAGDVIIINNNGKESIQVYAGDNEWYTIEENEPQQMEENWTENIEWYAYRISNR